MIGEDGGGERLALLSVLGLAAFVVVCTVAAAAGVWWALMAFLSWALSA